jgi:tetratricopeptide (TPR) repeat protein
MFRFALILIISNLLFAKEVIIDVDDLENSITRENQPIPEIKKIKKSKEQILKEKKANQFFTPEVLKPVDANKSEDNTTYKDDNLTVDITDEDDNDTNGSSSIPNFDFSSLSVEILDDDNPQIQEIQEIEVKKGNLIPLNTLLNEPKKPVITKNIENEKTNKKTKKVKTNYDREYKKKKKVIKLDVKSIQKPIYKGDYRYYYDLGMKQSAKKQYDKAIKSYKTSIKLNSKFSWNYYNIGYIHKIRHQYKTSILWYNKAIDRNPSFFWSFYDRANSYMMLDKYQKAINDLSVALELDKKSIIAHEDMATCYKKLEAKK